MSGFGSGGHTVTNNTTTPGAAPRRVMRLGLMADAGEITPQRDALAHTVMGRSELILLCGDQNYGIPGAVATNNAIFGAFPLRAVAGNHDNDVDGGVAHWGHFTNHPPFPPGLPGCYHEVIGGGLADLVVINGGVGSANMVQLPGHPSIAVGGPVHSWFTGLEFSTPHVILANHWPQWGPDSDTSTRYLPQFDWDLAALGVSVLVTGHIHRGWTGTKNGVRTIGVGGVSRSDASIGAGMPYYPGSSSTGGQVEWVAGPKMNTAAILSISPSSMGFEFLDTAGRVVYAGDVETSAQRTNSQVFEVQPSGSLITNSSIPVCMSCGPLELHGVTVCMENPSGSSVALKLGGVAVTAVTAVVAGPTHLPLLPLAASRLIMPGDRLSIEVSGSSTYAASNIEVALHGRLI